MELLPNSDETLKLRPARIQWLNEGTPYSLDFEDIYFSSENGLEESRYVFLEAQNISKRFQEFSEKKEDFKKHFSVFECGFGTGLNFLLTCEAFHPYQNDFKLVYTACEIHPFSKEDLVRVWRQFSQSPYFKNISVTEFLGEFEKKYPPCVPGVHALSFKGLGCELHLFFMSFEKTLEEFIGTVDVWYLDGFSPQKNPQMWQPDFLRRFSQFSKKNQTTCSSFTSAGWVRRGLEHAGFKIEKKKGFLKKREMIIGLFQGESELSQDYPEKNLKKSDRIGISGGGISGCSLAEELAHNGFEVTVLEEEKTWMGGASGNPLALTMPLIAADESPFFYGVNQAFFYARNLYQSYGIYKQCGTLKYPRSEVEKLRFQKFFERFFADPQWVQKGEGYVSFPQAGMIQPQRYFQSLRANPLLTHIQWQPSMKFKEADKNKFETFVYAHSTGIMAMDEYAWMPLKKVRGQIARVKAKRREEQILTYDGYLTPEYEGAHLLGASFDSSSSETTPSQRENQEMLQSFHKHFGACFTEEDILSNRVSFRLTTSDHLPIVGPAPLAQNFLNKRSKKAPSQAPLYESGVYFLTSMGSRGFIFAPYCARVLSALLLKEPLPIQRSLWKQLLPERFLLRQIKRNL